MKAVHARMTARLADGGTGTIDAVLVDAGTGEERYIVLSVDGYWGPLRVAPASTIWRVDEHVHLGLTCHEAATLPLYEPETYGAAAGLRRREHMTGGL